jgi:hypothetical protein
MSKYVYDIVSNYVITEIQKKWEFKKNIFLYTFLLLSRIQMKSWAE